MTYEVTIDGKVHRVELTRGKGGLECRAWEGKRERVGGELHLMIAGERYAAEVRDPRSFRARRAAGAGLEGPKKLGSPMPGKVVRALVAGGRGGEGGRGGG